MSRRFLTSLNILHQAVAPSNPVTGDMYFNTTNDSLYVYNGTTWVISSGGGGGLGYIDGGTAGGPFDTPAIDGGTA